MNSARVTGPAPFAGAGLSDTEAIVVFLSGLLDAGQVGEIGVELAAEVFEGVKIAQTGSILAVRTCLGAAATVRRRRGPLPSR